MFLSLVNDRSVRRMTSHFQWFRLFFFLESFSTFPSECRHQKQHMRYSTDLHPLHATSYLISLCVETWRLYEISLKSKVPIFLHQKLDIWKMKTTEKTARRFFIFSHVLLSPPPAYSIFFFYTLCRLKAMKKFENFLAFPSCCRRWSSPLTHSP